VSDTAVLAWHGGHRFMPYVFASSALASAAGLGLIAVFHAGIASTRVEVRGCSSEVLVVNELWALLEAEHEEIWSLLHELSNCADSGSAKRLARRLVPLPIGS
jgi:hypothetical protein